MKFKNDIETFYFQNLELNGEELAFVKALDFIIAGEESSAIDYLRNLWRNSNDDLIRSSSAQILFDLYFNEMEWNQIKKLGLLDEQCIDETNRTIAKQCSQVEKTKFSFSKDYICIPMKPSKTGSPTIEVTINGIKKWFWLDTGAGMTVISSSLAEACKIIKIPESDIQVGNSSDQNLNSDFAFVDLFEIEELKIENHPTLVIADNLLTMELPDGRMTIDGFIGWDIIHHFVLELDYLKHQVIIHKHKIIADIEHNIFFCGYPIIKVKSENQIPLYFGLDTGANKTNFGQSLLLKLDNLQEQQRLIQHGGVGGVNEKYVKSIENLHLYFSTNQVIQFEKLNQGLSEYATFFKLDGVFGIDITKGKRLVIDYPNRNIKLVE